MIEPTTRQELIKLYLEEIAAHDAFFRCNAEKLDVYEGNLMPYVQDVMQATLSAGYYSQIKDRILPINVLTRITDKLAKVYSTPPIRSDEKYQETVALWEEESKLNIHMNQADVFCNLFRGYALEPYIKDGMRRIRAIPYDRFIVVGRDTEDPLEVTDFIKFMGERKKRYGEKQDDIKTVRIFLAYTDSELIAFDSDGDELPEFYDGNEGTNIYGEIPFVYGRRSYTSLVPKQETDIMQLTKMIPVLLSDLGGAVMFQCFTIIYGVDLNTEGVVMAPNALWSFKSDTADGSKPMIGTINPSADVDKVLTFIRNTFALWLETKGVRIGSINSIDAGNAASGISKIIDEMDVYEIKKQQIEYFKTEEQQLWHKIWLVENHAQRAGLVSDGQALGEDFNPSIEFDEPRPEIGRREQVEIAKLEVEAGFNTVERAVKSLWPDLGEEEVAEIVGEVKPEVTLAADENKDRDPEEAPAIGESGASGSDR